MGWWWCGGGGVGWGGKEVLCWWCFLIVMTTVQLDGVISDAIVVSGDNELYSIRGNVCTM